MSVSTMTAYTWTDGAGRGLAEFIDMPAARGVHFLRKDRSTGWPSHQSEYAARGGAAVPRPPHRRSFTNWCTEGMRGHAHRAHSHPIGMTLPAIQAGARMARHLLVSKTIPQRLMLLEHVLRGAGHDVDSRFDGCGRARITISGKPTVDLVVARASCRTGPEAVGEAASAGRPSKRYPNRVRAAAPREKSSCA